MPLITSAKKRKLITELAQMLQQRPGPLRLFAKFPLVKQLSRFYIAGEKMSDAIRVAKEMRAEGKMVTIDHLGEETKRPIQAEEDAAVYKKLIQAISKEELVDHADLSLKLTQVGLNTGEGFCVEKLTEVLELAQERRVTVWVDMEGSKYTEGTIKIIEALRPRFPNLRGVIQAMMKSSNSHVARLLKLGATIRLCKGAYKEPPDIAYQHRAGDMRANFLKIADKQLFPSKIYHGIATHDEFIIKETIKLAKKHKLTEKDFEFQMLYGVKKELQDELIKLKYQLRLYVPFGEDWLPYFLRRVSENPDIAEDFTHDLIERLHTEHNIDLHWLHPHFKHRE